MDNESNYNPDDNRGNAYNYSYNMVPPEIKRWNWGAFTFNIWWGIGNKVYLPLLCLIPVFNIVWIFVCAVKGNEWVWQTGEFSSPAELMKCQESWNRAGFVSFIVAVIVIAIYIIVIVGILGATLNFYNSSYSYL